MLIGASRDVSPSLHDLPSVSDNIAALAGLLSSPEILGLAASQLTVIDNRLAPRRGEAVRSAADAATDTLIVYFAGHGLIEARTGELHFAVGNSIVCGALQCRTDGYATLSSMGHPVASSSSIAASVGVR